MPLDEKEIYTAKEREYRFVIRTLGEISFEEGWEDDNNWLPNVFVIAGGATGPDTIAIDWAVVNWCQFKEYPADWDKYGKRAGFVRNHQMLVEGKPDLVIAFPGGNGTAHMVNIAKAAGIRVREITYEAPV